MMNMKASNTSALHLLLRHNKITKIQHVLIIVSFAFTNIFALLVNDLYLLLSTSAHSSLHTRVLLKSTRLENVFFKLLMTLIYGPGYTTTFLEVSEDYWASASHFEFKK